MTQLPSESVANQTPREDLRGIAQRQKAIMVCILLYIAAVAAQFFIPPEIRPMVGLVVLAMILVATVFVFMLAIKLYGTGVGVLLGILTLIPLIGLIVLLIVNGKATSTLRANGIEVGLMGAKGEI